MSPARLVAACALAAALWLAPSAGAQAPTRTISVTGEATVAAANDTARLGFGVESRGASRPAALHNSSARLARVLAAIRRLGVADRDLRTRRVSVARRRDRRGRKLPGYVARGGVSVVVGGGGESRSQAAPAEPGRTRVFGTVYVVFEAG